MLANGNTVPAAGGTFCQVPDAEIVMEVPSSWEPFSVPIWAGDVADGALVKDAIVGHVTVQSDQPRPDELTTNSLVYFPSGDPTRRSR